MNGICRILITLVTVFVGFGVWAVEPDSNGNHPGDPDFDSDEFSFY